MFLRRAVTSTMVVVVLSIIGFLGNNAALGRDQADLAYNHRNLVRLHVVANSDRAIDQEIKLKVRDAVLAQSGSIFMGIRDAREALRLAARNQGEIAALATRTAREAGASYQAKVEVGRFHFPTKTYPFGTLPAGEYDAVRITLGRGQGHNWWCVLFPPLCFMTPEQERVEGPVRVRLNFLERILADTGLSFDEFWRGWARFWRLPVEAVASLF